MIKYILFVFNLVCAVSTKLSRADPPPTIHSYAFHIVERSALECPPTTAAQRQLDDNLARHLLCALFLRVCVCRAIGRYAVGYLNLTTLTLTANGYLYIYQSPECGTIVVSLAALSTKRPLFASRAIGAYRNNASIRLWLLGDDSHIAPPHTPNRVASPWPRDTTLRHAQVMCMHMRLQRINCVIARVVFSEGEYVLANTRTHYAPYCCCCLRDRIFNSARERSSVCLCLSVFFV